MARDPSEAVTNSHTTIKVSRSTRRGQRPKIIEIIHARRVGGETVCGI